MNERDRINLREYRKMDMDMYTLCICMDLCFAFIELQYGIKSSKQLYIIVENEETTSESITVDKNIILGDCVEVLSHIKYFMLSLLEVVEKVSQVRVTVF